MIRVTAVIIVVYIACFVVAISHIEGVDISVGEFMIITFLAIIANLLNSRIK